TARSTPCWRCVSTTVSSPGSTSCATPRSCRVCSTRPHCVAEPCLSGGRPGAPAELGRVTLRIWQIDTVYAVTDLSAPPGRRRRDRSLGARLLDQGRPSLRREDAGRVRRL